MERLASV